jgi:hypothetical protein
MLVAYAYFADLTQWMYMFEDFVLYFVFAVFVAQCKPSSIFFGDSPTFHIFGMFLSGVMFYELILRCHYAYFFIWPTSYLDCDAFYDGLFVVSRTLV